MVDTAEEDGNVYLQDPTTGETSPFAENDSRLSLFRSADPRPDKAPLTHSFERLVRAAQRVVGDLMPETLFSSSQRAHVDDLAAALSAIGEDEPRPAKASVRNPIVSEAWARTIAEGFTERLEDLGVDVSDGTVFNDALVLTLTKIAEGHEEMMVRRTETAMPEIPGAPARPWRAVRVTGYPWLVNVVSDQPDGPCNHTLIAGMLPKDGWLVKWLLAREESST